MYLLNTQQPKNISSNLSLRLVSIVYCRWISIVVTTKWPLFDSRCTFWLTIYLLTHNSSNLEKFLVNLVCVLYLLCTVDESLSSSRRSGHLLTHKRALMRLIKRRAHYAAAKIFIYKSCSDIYLLVQRTICLSVCLFFCLFVCLLVQGWCSCITHLPDESNPYCVSW